MAVRAWEKGGSGRCGTCMVTGGWFTWLEHKLVLRWGGVGWGGVGVGLWTGPHRTGAGVQEQQDLTKTEDLPGKRKQTVALCKRTTVGQGGSPSVCNTWRVSGWQRGSCKARSMVREGGVTPNGTSHLPGNKRWPGHFILFGLSSGAL